MLGSLRFCSSCRSRTARWVACGQWRAYSSTLDSTSKISPVLLSRARSLAEEHDTLSAIIAEKFDTRAAKRIGELARVTKALKEWDDNTESVRELRALIQDSSTDSELRALAVDDLESTNAHLNTISHSLTLGLVPEHPFAHLPCLIEIRPGVGGGEAALFAGDLLRMYQAYCARHGLRTSLLKYEDGEGQSESGGTDTPLQEAILEVENPGSYGQLRCEAGVHRVQRIPATESKGRTHTSVASVLVLPSISNESEDLGEDSFDDPTSDYYVEPKDVRTDVMRARGAGGQHVNTTDSAVRLVHLPTNTVVSIQDSRSQHKNRAKAWRILRSRIAQARREAREDELVKLKNSIKGVSFSSRSDKVRTYNWGQQRVTDHRSGLTVHNLDDVIRGGEALDTVMESVKNWMNDRDIAALAAES